MQPSINTTRFDQRIYQENLLLKKVLSVTVIQPGDPNDPLAQMQATGSGSGGAAITYLPSANQELVKMPGIKSMLEKKTLFDTIFSDILAMPQRYGFVYLLECFQNYAVEKDKAVNKDPRLQELLAFMMEMTMNYASLLALYPDMFPATLPANPQHHEGVALSAFRLLHLLENHGYSSGFMNALNLQIKGKDEEEFKEVYRFIFSGIRSRFQTADLTIFDPQACTLLDILTNIIAETDELKEIFVTNRQGGIAWIPGPGGISLEKGIGSCTGDLLENASVLGPFFSISFLPNSLTLRGDDRFKRTGEKAESELKSAKSQQAYEKIALNLQEYHHKYLASLNNFLRTLIKGKTVRENVMRFLAACIVANTQRAKLGHNLAQNAMQNRLNTISSDSFCLNAMYALHELCVPFLNLNDPKANWKKIDPTYLPSGLRIDVTDETPICASRDMRQPLKFPKEFGTISEFYFMELEMLHFGLLHTIHKYLDVRKLIDKLKDDRKAFEGQQDMVDKIDKEIAHLRPFRIAYELALCDNSLAKLTERFYTVHLRLMREWGEFDEKGMRFGRGSHPNLYCYLPENCMTDFIEVFTELIKTHPREHKAFLPETAVDIYEFCLALLRTDSKSVTNPYTKAKALELMTIFVYADRKSELSQHFAKSDFISKFLMETVVQFYIDIEFAGQSMFFTKFQYRHDCSKLFQRFWTQERYRVKMREQLGQEHFDRFLNCLINDMTYCLEEGLVKIEKIKKFETLMETEGGKNLSKEDQDNHQQDRSICRANFQLAGECIWIVMQLSDWCKAIFNNEDFSERIANTLNFVLSHLVGDQCARTQIRDPDSVSFKPIPLLQELCTIYTNLSEIPHFCKSVVKDERSFKPEYLNQALRKLRISKVGMNLADLEKFIKKIPEYTQQEAQLEEILGNNAPEEFICPISCTLMREPVKLPTSGNVCDLVTMKRILLNNEYDPFNRAPLKLSDLQEDRELKARIERWIQQKLAGVEETDEDIRAKNQSDQPPQIQGTADKDEEMKMAIDDNDYSGAFFDDDQLLELRNTSSDKPTTGLIMSQSQFAKPLGQTQSDRIENKYLNKLSSDGGSTTAASSNSGITPNGSGMMQQVPKRGSESEDVQMYSQQSTTNKKQ